MDAPLGLLFKRLLLVFWTMFFSLVALTNLVDLLDELGAFDWRFLDSENYDYLRSVVKAYDVGPTVTKLLLAGALAIELVAAALFWRALAGLGKAGRGMREAFVAVCFGTFVWIAFVFMTEFFTAYQSESPFRELLAIMIGTALALVLVRDDVPAVAS
jgi:hypothetical protein